MPIRQMKATAAAGTGTSGMQEFPQAISGAIRTIAYHETNAPAGVDVNVQTQIDGRWVQIDSEDNVDGSATNFVTRYVDGKCRLRYSNGDADTSVDCTIIYLTFTD